MSSNQVSINMERTFKLEDDFEKSCVCAVCAKEDEEYEINLRKRKDEDWEKKELMERKEKRQAVVAKHKEVLNAMIIGKQKGIRFRRYFYKFVFSVSEKDFESWDEEYEYIGKPYRRRWNDHEEHLKSFNVNDPMHSVIGEIMLEFGCFDY